MAEGTIDRLSIDIAASSSAAARNIEQLAAGLVGLRDAVGDGASRLDGLARSMSTLKAATQGNGLASVASSIGRIADAVSRMPADASARLSGLSAIGRLSGIKVSSTVAKSLQGVTQAVAAMPEGTSAKLAGLTSALRPLSSLNGVRVGQLGKLPSVLKEFSSLDMAGLASKMKELNASLGPLASSVERLAKAYGVMPTSMRSAGVAAKSVASANRNLAGINEKLAASGMGVSRTLGGWVSTISTLRAKVVAFGHVLKNSIGAAINEVNTYIENMNLFQAAMGGYTDSAAEFGNKVQSLMGIDFGEWARNQGVFMTLATGMGVTADKASVMSQQLTQLGYDISSFYNLDVQEAMLKLQSGLAGELEPLRRIGWDLSNARMNLELAKMGIEGNAESMTQAEKVAMRYKMIMEQVTITHGDMARTIASPANQIRVLKAQVTLAARAVGNLFIPALNAILPVAIGVVKAIRLIAQSIAKLFNIDATFEVDYSTLDTSGIAVANDAVDDTADALDDAGKAAEKAEKKVREYQNTVMGFDELNKLNATPEYNDEDSSGSGAGDAGDVGGAGGDFGLPTYDFLEGLNDWVTRLSDNIARNLVDALKKVVPIAAGIGTAFGLWRVAPALSKGLETLSRQLGNARLQANLLSKELRAAGNVKLGKVVDRISIPLGGLAVAMSGLAGNLGKLSGLVPIAAAVGLIAAHFTNLAINSENFRRGMGQVLEWAMQIPTPLGIAKSAVEAISGFAKSIAGFFSDIGRSLGEWWANLPDVGFWGAFKGIVEGIAAALEKTGIPAAFMSALEVLNGAFAGISDTLGYLLFDVLDVQWSDAFMGAAAVLALFTGHPAIAALILVAEGISLAIRAIGWATSPVVEEIDALANVSEETAQIFGTSIDSMQDNMQAISEFDWANKIITEEDVARIQKNVEDIHNTIVNNLDAKRNEELASIDALAGVMTDEEVEAAKQKVNEYYDDLIGIVDNGQAEMLEIIATAQSEERNLTEAESERIKQINDEQYKYLLETSGASAEEINEIRRAMDNNDKASALEAARVVCEAAKQAKKEQTTAAEETYQTVYNWATRMRDTGDMTEEEYQRVMAAAEKTKNKTVDAAEKQYEQIRRETEEGLGAMASSFDWETGQIEQNWQSWLRGLVDWWQWFADTIGQGIQVGGIAGSYSFETSGSPYAVRQYAEGGFPTSGQLFMAREDGIPEMVGSMGGKNAVANNQQIVEGIEQGVMSAMIQVLPSFQSSQSEGDVTLVVNIDSQELARAEARGRAQAARRGQLKPEFQFV